jgi:glycosyltransferase involved in cell wall biosynthesis
MILQRHFRVPAGCEAERRDGSTDLAIALAMGGIPVVTDGAQDTLVLAHERNAFVVDRGDDRGFASTVNDILSLPALQRHFLGLEFARFTLARWPWDGVAEVYGERLAALVGRPQIPADLRAA